ncbi:LysR family transcriptional regulator [Candidatus Rhodobacter oscarellae]|nr:LysR family transcriptional regulator [Candidatus Rhodobacter lobularis]
MLRSFVTLARTLNVSDAAQELGVTRQTFRRYINDLEVIRGGKLLTLKRGRYALTTLGMQFLQDANEILWRVNSCDIRNRYSLRKMDGFEHSQYLGADGRKFYSQQHSLSSVNTTGLPIVKELLRAWGTSATQLEHEEMDAIRPYLVIYRRSQRGWICADIGDNSAYGRWFGSAWAKSARGALSEDDQVGDEFNTFVSRAYSEIYYGGSIRIDHLFAYLPRGGFDAPQPVNFQRVLAGCVFPDGQQALAVLVAITNRVEIQSIPEAERFVVTEELIMDGEKI